MVVPNRLQGHPSPYLEQHQDNPVDWWPWCPEAFEEARRRDVPVFLSIGYATCHWCHVMAHESFEDDAVAAAMNDAFVCIKVDREERPDIDDAYMSVCQAMTGSGGWPLTIIMAPDKRPFFAGTYFPKQTRGRIGMLDLVPRITQAWREQRDELEHQADHLVAHFHKAPAAPGEPDPAWFRAAVERLLGSYDAEQGGFGGAPKFPSTHQVRFLLAWAQENPEDELADAARDAALGTLAAIERGGIHDHAGGGFHRYATDAEWRLPHFEKMLYDQAALVAAFTDAWTHAKDPRFQAAVEDTIAYMERDLQHPEGAWYAAEDADSEGEEGRFYVWDAAEVIERVGADVAAAYDIRPEGNFLDEATRQRTGKNVLYRLGDAHPAAMDRLRSVRESRVRPLRDEKILTDWNGLAIGAVARAGAAFGRPDWIDQARRAAAWVLDTMRVDGRLRHRYRDGRIDDTAFLDDHAFLAWGLLELHRATQDLRWLDEAAALAQEILDRFDAGAGFDLAPHDAEPMVVTRRGAFDGAIPSGNAVAVDVLARLGRILDGPFTEAAWRTLRGFAADVGAHPHAFTALLTGYASLEGAEVVITGDGPRADDLFHAALRGGPHTIVLRHSPGLVQRAPWCKDYHGDGLAYVCRNKTCDRPVDDVEALRQGLGLTA